MLGLILLFCTILKRDIKDLGLYSLSDLDSLIYIAIAFSAVTTILTHHISDEQPDGYQFTSGRSGVLSQPVLIQVSSYFHLTEIPGSFAAH